MTDNSDPNAAYSEVFEEGMESRQAQTVHRIRANSSIMQLKKILGEYKLYGASMTLGHALITDFVLQQSLIEGRFVSIVPPDSYCASLLG